MLVGLALIFLGIYIAYVIYKMEKDDKIQRNKGRIFIFNNNVCTNYVISIRNI